MRKIYRRPSVQTFKPRYRINQFITADPIRLIDENGEHFGEISLAEALAKANAAELDLVEIGPKANPVVCKIISYGKLQYEEEKQARKQKAKQKKTELKGIRLSLRIGQHDLDVRIKQAISFLDEDNKVKIEMMLRGRERQHTEMAKQIINQFLQDVQAQGKIAINTESPISVQGGRISVVIGKK